jgi:hypothetical protein
VFAILFDILLGSRLQEIAVSGVKRCQNLSQNGTHLNNQYHLAKQILGRTLVWNITVNIFHVNYIVSWLTDDYVAAKKNISF